MTHGTRITLYTRYVPWLVLIATPLVLFWRIVFAGRVLFWGVPLLQFYPWQQLAVEMWRSGNAPLWNPLVGNGAPLAANLQTAAFYPLNALYWLLPTESGMSYTAVLHVVLAGLAMYAWGRAFGLRSLSALVSALAFQLSQFLIARFGFLSITATFPWLAVWLWRTEVLVQRRRLSNALWLAVTVGLGLLAGHAQTAGAGLIVVVCYAALRQISNGGPSTARRHLLSSVCYLLLAFLVGIALASVQLLPSSELSAQSQRASGLDYEFAATHSLHPLRLLTFLAPDLMGNPADGNFWGYDNYWENAAYVGVWALLMALFALIVSVCRNRRPAVTTQNPIPGLRLPISDLRTPTSVTWFFAATVLLSLLIALGRFAPFYPILFRALPGAALFQGPARLLSVYTLAIAALAGMGTDQLLVGDRLRWSGRLLIIAAVGVLIATWAGAALIHVPQVFVRPAFQFGLTLGACAACLAARPPVESRWFKWWACALIGVVLADLLAADWRLNPTTDAALYRSPTAAARAVSEGRVFWFSSDEQRIKFDKYFSFKRFGPQDSAYWLGVRESLLPNAAMIERVPAVNNFDSLLPGHFNDVMQLLDHLSPTDALKVAGMMNARYLISPREWALPIVQRTADATIYRNDAALGRAWIVPQARVVSDTLAALADPSFDPRQVVLVEAADAPALPSREFVAGPWSATLRDSPNAVTIRAASQTGGFLVLADTFYPGWQVMLDGKPVKVLCADHAFRAIVLPPGERTVVFQYVPLSFRVGALVSGLTLAVVIVIWITLPRRCRM